MALRSTSPQRLDIRHFLTVKRTRSAIEVDLLMRDRHRLLLDPKLTVLLRLQRLLCGNSARNRGTARATALGRTSPFPGETGKVRCRRNPAVHHGIGEGRQPFPLRTLDGPRFGRGENPEGRARASPMGSRCRATGGGQLTMCCPSAPRR